MTTKHTYDIDDDQAQAVAQRFANMIQRQAAINIAKYSTDDPNEANEQAQQTVQHMIDKLCDGEEVECPQRKWHTG